MNDVIEQISKRSRTEILKKVSEGYHPSSFCRVETQDPVEHIQMQEDLIENMKLNMTNNKFVVHDIKESVLYETINSIIAAEQAHSLVYPQDLGLELNNIHIEHKRCFDRAIEEIREEVFTTDLSIINVFAGVASHGVACVVSTDKQPRMLSLVTPTCIMLLKKEHVVKSLVDALHKVKSTFDPLPTNVLFIAGPSRTSDVELVTVFGVHGSTQVHLVLY